MRLLALLLLTLAVSPVAAQNWGSVEGRVTEAATGEPLPGVTVIVAGTDFGTATSQDGSYLLRLPQGRYSLRISAVGFVPVVDSVAVRRDQPTVLDVRLRPSLLEMEGITVEEAGGARGEAGVHDLKPEDVRNIPSPFKGYQALKAMPGVATNNELSNQYSVRGGGFNENLIFIDGFEVYMPFRPRQGEQEGVGLLNPEMAERITFYTGGFPARYGGKLSSALDIAYRRPAGEPLQGSASLSLLDAGATAGGSGIDGRVGWLLGLRKARARHFFSTQELRGDYRPDYTDLQGLLTYRMAPGHSVEALGMWVDHAFNLDPSNRKTYFGSINIDPNQPSNLQSVWIDYNGREEDRYATRFAGLRLSNRLSSSLRIEHGAAYFETVEDEFYRVSGSAVLYQVDPQSGNPTTGAGHIPTGSVKQEDAADNRVGVGTWTGHGRWQLALRRHAAEAGWSLRRLHFEDRLMEHAAVVGRNRDGDIVRVVVDSLNDAAALNEMQGALYVQDVVDLMPEQGRFTVTGGVRADYFSFNDEWTISPRLSARFVANPLLTLTGAWGVYYQTPTYRELRGAPAVGETILGALNRDIRSQRSMQFLTGAEYFMPTRRLYIRGEAYYKHLSDLISYSVENVRILYSGENDTQGHAYGLDLQLRGEFVPGLESWANYSYLRTSERFLPEYLTRYNQGLVPRPTDQRHTVSLYIQDYVPGNPTWKIHMMGLFGSGLPYTPPVPGPRIGNIVTQIPGRRFSARYPEYMRMDAGVTKQIVLSERSNAPLRLHLTAEMLNVFDMTNTVAYSWVPGRDGIWQRIPTRLTPRTFNIRVRVDF